MPRLLMQIDYEFIQRNWLEGNYGYSEFLPQTLQPINCQATKFDMKYGT